MTTYTELAEMIARKAHSGQMYGKKPYAHHLGKVVENAALLGADVAVAWLHDVLEDTDTTEEELRKLFSDTVVDAVVALTRRDGSNDDEYYAAVAKNPLAARIKIADLTANLEESVFHQPNHKWASGYAARLAELLRHQ